MNAQKLTQKALEAIQTAQNIAIENQNIQILPEHLFYALLDGEDGLVNNLFRKMGKNPDALLAETDTLIRKLPAVSGSGREPDKVYISPLTDKILTAAEKLAAGMKDDYVSVEHIMLCIFDCLNDMRNLQTAVKAANKEKAHAQVALSYTLGDAYTLEYWVNIAKRIEEMGADSICIKDMAGLLLPYKATELVGALKDAVSIPIDLHTHYTSGVASMTYLKAVEAGVDIIDTAMSPFALGTSQPATEVMVETFKGTPYDTGFDQKLLAEIADYFRPIRDEALDSGLLNPKNLGVNIKTLLYQVPGGMLSNLTSQLKEQHAEDKFYDVLEEVPKVRKDLGEPPLVTPSSQIVGTQAVFNVLMGERYKMVTKETKDILLGKYGATVKPFNQEVQKKCIGDAKPITCRPADLLENEMDKLEKEVAPYKEQDEDVLSYALFPQVATDFFKYRQAQEKKVDEKAADTKNGAYPV